MATRRKYRQPLRFRDGGAVPLAEQVDPPTVDDAPPALAAEPEPIAAAIAPEPEHAASLEDNALWRAAQAAQRAEELARDPFAARRAEIDRHVDNLQGLTEHKRRFLKSHPEVLLDPVLGQTMSRVYDQSLSAGIVDDTPDMDRALIEGMQREIMAQRLQVAQRDPDVERLDREAATIRADMGMGLPPPLPLAPPPAPAAPMPRRNIPMSAPVSRDIPSATGGRIARDARSVTLTPAEREIARNSFSDPRMTNAEKELLYAQNKLKLRRMRADGSYPERERN